MNLECRVGKSRQRGLGMMSVFLIICVTVFIGLFAFKIGPHYIENWTVNEIIDDVVADKELLSKSRRHIYDSINSAYRNNNLWDLNAEDTVELESNGYSGYTVAVRYEKRATLFHNIDLVTSFDSVHE